MRYVRSLLLVALCGGFVATAPDLRFHLRLTKSLPAAEADVTQAPRAVRLWFNQRPSLAVSRITLEGPDGKVDVGAVQATNDTLSFQVPIEASLAPGSYTVGWRTAGLDGHVLRGDFPFSLVAPATPDK